MYGVDKYTTIKSLLGQGKNKRSMAKLLNINPRTVRRICERLDSGKQGPDPVARSGLLEPLSDRIKHWYCGEGLSAELIHDRLLQDHGLQQHYATTARFCQRFKHSEVFVPLHAGPEEEGQVDFAYLGSFSFQGRQRKVWVFGMVLSNSRYSYYEAVLD